MSFGVEVLVALAFEGWEWQHWLMYCAVMCTMMGGLGVLLQGPYLWSCWCGKMPFKGKVLEDSELGLSDYGFVFFNKLVTCAYVYHAVTYLRSVDYITTAAADLSAVNTVVAVLLMLGVYDSFYVPFHRALHLPALYPLVHKHHHKQSNPYRAMFDAINVHPLEFVTGEYLHLVAIWAVGGKLLPMLGYKLHIAGLGVFLVFTGLAAQVNHTRWMVRIPFVYDATTHDTHHKLPRSNYCQYVPWWDHLYGSYLPYVRDITEMVAKRREVKCDPQLAQ